MEPKPNPADFTFNGVLQQPHYDYAVRAWEKMEGMEEVEYYVRWRHISPELMFTPVMLISVDHTVVKAKKNATEYQIQIAVAEDLKILNIDPDHVRLESFQLYTR